MAAALVGTDPFTLGTAPRKRRPKGMIVGKLPAAMLLGERVGEWWAERSTAVREWIATNPLKIGIPNDRTLETIKAALERGDAFESDAVRTKCWFHVLIELEGVASLDVVNSDAEGQALSTAQIESALAAVCCGERKAAEVQTDISGACVDGAGAGGAAVAEPSPVPLDSPCRGRLRPGKRVVGADEVEGAEDGTGAVVGVVGMLEPKTASSSSAAAAAAAAAVAVAAQVDASVAAKTAAKVPAAAAPATAGAAAPLVPPKRKSITAGMSMMERQKLWMEQKAEKLQFEQQKKEAEEAAQNKKPETNSRGKWSSVRTKVIGAAKVAAAGAKAAVEREVAGGAPPAKAPAKAPTPAQQQPRPPEGAKTGKGRRPIAADKGSGGGGGKGGKENNGAGGGRKKSATGNKLSRKKSKGGSDLLADVLKLSKQAEAMKPHPVEEAAKAAQAAVPETDGGALSPTPEEEEGEEAAGAAAVPTAPLPPPPSTAEKAALKYAANGHKAFKFRFAENSTEEKGRFCVADPEAFDATTFYRKRDTGTRQRGVTLVVGKLEEGGHEKVCSILFDRDHFDEGSASQWWDAHSARLL